ncbi:MAG: Hsp20 family protein [Reyranella sp.]|nr:Hsp20 family protein [Reyranella sp.]
MRTFDYSPFYRATVGFDRVFNLLDSVAGQSAGQTGSNGYPPYNIEKSGDNDYRIVMAVAGFAEAELNVTQKENELLVTGQSASSTAADGENEKQYLYRGIAGRNFERRFQLADHVKVIGAKLANGLLTIELQREIPEEKKARAIPVVANAQPALTH